MDWNIRKGGDSCLRCERPLMEGDYCYSVIEVQQSQIARNDFCEACFLQEPEEMRAVFWRTRKAVSGPPKKVVNFEWVRELFFKMLEVDEPAFKEMAYLLALVLIRKRHLKLKDFISHEGKDFMEVRRNKGEPLLRIEVPLIAEEDIEELRGKLSHLLEVDLDGEPDIGSLRKALNKEPNPQIPAPDNATSSEEQEPLPPVEESETPNGDPG